MVYCGATPPRNRGLVLSGLNPNQFYQVSVRTVLPESVTTLSDKRAKKMSPVGVRARGGAKKRGDGSASESHFLSEEQLAQFKECWKKFPPPHSSLSESLLLMTRPLCPENLRVRRVRARRVELQWSAPRGGAFRYVVEQARGAGDAPGEWQVCYSGAQLDATVMCESDTLYTLRVYSVNKHFLESVSATQVEVHTKTH